MAITVSTPQSRLAATDELADRRLQEIVRRRAARGLPFFVRLAVMVPADGKAMTTWPGQSTKLVFGSLDEAKAALAAMDEFWAAVGDYGLPAVRTAVAHWKQYGLARDLTTRG